MTNTPNFAAKSDLPAPGSALAILISGGIDSAILLAESVQLYAAVHPLYVRSGLQWEEAEQAHLARFLTALACPALQPLKILDMPTADLYGRHWSTSARDVPDDRSSDEAVYLAGRNVLLIAKALLWCHLQAIPVLALAVLQANPFPDATPGFFAAIEQALNLSVGGKVAIRRPYAHLTKAEVLKRGRWLPLEWTFSCLNPSGDRHCGECNKCAERRRGFVEADMEDPTPYVRRNSCTA
jgi:7-cyano-7-deazaguanine synthase